MARFANRADAGRHLARAVRDAVHDAAPDAVVLGLPRGGVPVAAEVARALHAPLDVLIVRKLGVPDHPELGLGAIGEGGVRVLDPELVRWAGVTEDQLAAVEAGEQRELARRAQRYRRRREMIPVGGRTVVIVDDGLATGGTARAAIAAVRALGASRVVLAVPVGAPETIRALAEVADDVVVVMAPPVLRSVGEWYGDFRQTSDEEVVALLDAARREIEPRHEADRAFPVSIAADGVTLAGDLTWPAAPTGLVVFAHGSGSSRRSPRNVAVARLLNRAGFATLLFDLLTDEEAGDRRNVFDIPFLGARLLATTAWLRRLPAVAGLPVGYFGASTGAAAALWAAAAPGNEISAVVSRGGRPDLAGARLAEVRSPTLLIVGSNDEVVLDLNREAAARLRCEHRLEIVPGATHLFEEPGTLEQAAHLAAGWFARCFHDHGSSRRSA